MAKYRPKPPHSEAGLHLISGTPDGLLIAENGSSTFVTLQDTRQPGPLDLSRLIPYEPSRPTQHN